MCIAGSLFWVSKPLLLKPACTIHTNLYRELFWFCVYFLLVSPLLPNKLINTIYHGSQAHSPRCSLDYTWSCRFVQDTGFLGTEQILLYHPWQLSAGPCRPAGTKIDKADRWVFKSQNLNCRGSPDFADVMIRVKQCQNVILLFDADSSSVQKPLADWVVLLFRDENAISSFTGLWNGQPFKSVFLAATKWSLLGNLWDSKHHNWSGHSTDETWIQMSRADVQNLFLKVFDFALV